MPASMVLPRPTSSARMRAPVEVAHHLQARPHLVREALDAAQRIERDQAVGARPAGPAARHRRADRSESIRPRALRRHSRSSASLCGCQKRVLAPAAAGGGPVLSRHRHRGRFAVHDVPLALRRQSPQLAVEHHLEHLAAAIGMHLDDQAVAELRMAQPLPHLVARRRQFHSGNSSPRFGTCTCERKLRHEAARPASPPDRVRRAPG